MPARIQGRGKGIVSPEGTFPANLQQMDPGIQLGAVF